MKKLLCCLLAFSSLFCMSACQQSNTSKQTLSYGEKYIPSRLVGQEEEKQTYYIFNKDGTAEYHYYYTGSTQVFAYTIYLKYQIVEEESMVFCFYDGVRYSAEDTEKSVESDFTAEFMYTENFLMSTGGGIYLAESYLEEIPNFGK
ncbi:MAG: hypothetical protein IKB20_00790 [Clostridia bacterium]|nr:hypothetical protein [Clostridia bacterium]